MCLWESASVFLCRDWRKPQNSWIEIASVAAKIQIACLQYKSRLMLLNHKLDEPTQQTSVNNTLWCSKEANYVSMWLNCTVAHWQCKDFICRKQLWRDYIGGPRTIVGTLSQETQALFLPKPCHDCRIDQFSLSEFLTYFVPVFNLLKTNLGMHFYPQSLKRPSIVLITSTLICLVWSYFMIAGSVGLKHNISVSIYIVTYQGSVMWII